MGLSKYKIGQLITISNEKNLSGRNLRFMGINSSKEFMPTVATTDNLNNENYKVVTKKQFVFSGMQTGRDMCIRIAIYLGDEDILVSPAYTTFEITSDIVLPKYFFMIFMSSEMDRYGAFLSAGSIRSNLDWDVFCDIDLQLPDITTQQKCVDIYEAMVENQKAYETGLDDLKLTCDAYIEKLRRGMRTEHLGKHISDYDERNFNNAYQNIIGININKQFIPTIATTDNLDIKKYKIIKKNCFVFSGMQTGRDKCIRVGLFSDEEPAVTSPAYTTFSIKKSSKLLPEYLMLLFMRKESDRLGWFYSDGSVRSNLDWDRFCEMQFFIPERNVQQVLVDLYTAYNERKAINEQLKAKLKNMCPILIKGSIEEGRK